VSKPDRDAAGFWDAAEWESVQKEGDEATKRWIDKQLEGTSVTVVLIGAETCSRKWVRYEIQRSYEKGNGIVGIYIHNLKDQNGEVDRKGELDFGKIDGKDFVEIARIYDWELDNGYENMGDWIERSHLITSRPNLEPPAVRSVSRSQLAGRGCIRR